jgi:hypothetical protein
MIFYSYRTHWTGFSNFFKISSTFSTFPCELNCFLCKMLALLMFSSHVCVWIIIKSFKHFANWRAYIDRLRCIEELTSSSFPFVPLELGTVKYKDIRKLSPLILATFLSGLDYLFRVLFLSEQWWKGCFPDCNRGILCINIYDISALIHPELQKYWR